MYTTRTLNFRSQPLYKLLTWKHSNSNGSQQNMKPQHQFSYSECCTQMTSKTNAIAINTHMPKVEALPCIWLPTLMVYMATTTEFSHITLFNL